MASALLCGATGLVGGECLKLLADDPGFQRVVVLTRRPLPQELPRPATHAKIEERIIDFDRLPAVGPGAAATRRADRDEDPDAAAAEDPDAAAAEDPADLVPRVDQVICALGTTRKRAGSKERFRQVDFGYPAAIARLAAERGARHFLLVSAVGASSGSRVFYNRVKGELEDAVRELPFRSVTIIRPSLLLGERDEFRLGEEIGKRLAFLVPARYRPVDAADVAAALLLAATEDAPGRRVVESAEIPAAAGEYRTSGR